ncbi:hypothetical protein PoB_000270300 [Plakobranchus ocellatus]|uniref:Uncharacterized protein n=1 Tax=Plakobranchus ocellatus TaxID=259542 RepID=A0AAV3Y1G5_9GAST|nr:hypothetical protein PoB_000270300 [Plakobranchus ocellatus]
MNTNIVASPVETGRLSLPNDSLNYSSTSTGTKDETVCFLYDEPGRQHFTSGFYKVATFGVDQLKHHVFTTFGFDNIDHNPRQTTSRPSFHGSCISMLQFPPNRDGGMIDKTEDPEALRRFRLQDLNIDEL